MSAISPPSDRTGPRRKSPPAPVMRVNFFDRLSAGMISTVIGLSVGVLAVFLWWLSTRPPRQEFLAPMELVNASGGSADGAPNETLDVQSPEDAVENASATEDVLETDVTQAVQNVVELATVATEQAQQVSSAGVPGGSPGSAHGSGRKALGSGQGQGGIPNEQRWVIRYSDEASLAEYAKQLDHFGIELGALLPDGQMIYLSKISSAMPVQRAATSGKDEQRLYMTWQGGSRKDADVKLFARVGLDVSRAILFHFYPKPIEQLLMTREYQYAKRNALDIRRTYFSVVKQGEGFDFAVTRQIYLR
jgi:hypothetical protein